jgi:hypothetical protein
MGSGGEEARAACPLPVPVQHYLDSHFACQDTGHAGALAYALAAPAAINTGAADIYCAGFDGPYCLSAGAGSEGDGQAAIGADWSDPAAGCPVGSQGSERIVVVVATTGPLGGSSLVVSVGAADPNAGYVMELAHPYDPEGGAIAPLACADSAVVVWRTSGQAAIRFRFPPVHSDCDPGSLGRAILGPGACPDGFVLEPLHGSVRILQQPCDAPIDLRRGAWADTGIVPDAAGQAVVPVPSARGDACVFAGVPAILDGEIEGEAIAAFVRVECADLDADGDGHTDCADCDDGNVAVHPGAPEICNGIDDDCDGQADEIEDLFGDADGDGVATACDNCPEVLNAGQEDRDRDGLGDACDVCPTIPNPANDPCDCEAPGCPRPPPLSVTVTIGFSSPLGRGSGVVAWTVSSEVEVLGYNVIVHNQRGEQVQQNDVLIPCQECVTGLGARYEFIIPKHRSGRDIFVELVRRDGIVFVFGPATRVP